MSVLVGAFGASPALAQDVALMASSLSAVDGSVSTAGNAEVGCYIAWTGASCAPSNSNGITLVFSGEEFSERSSAGGRIQSLTYVTELYARYGFGFVERLNGRFSGVLIDAAKKTAILFNDRFGLDRIYFCSTSAGFFFATQAKALLRIFNTSQHIDVAAAAQVFSVGCVMQGRTLFPGIEILPPATSVVLRDRSAWTSRQYFQPSSWEQQEKLEESSFYACLRELFSRVIPRYTCDQEQCAMSLTGGLDGRMIMAWSRAKAGDLPCYSFNGPYRECHDVRIARDIAASCSQPHQVINIGRDFLDQFAELACQTIRVSDGTMDVSGAVELYANQLARDIAPVRITGNYGSEIMRGNVAFRPRRWSHDLFEPEFKRKLEQAEHVYREERRGDDLSFIAFKQVPWHHYARFSVERSQVVVRSPFLDNEIVALMYRAPRPLHSLSDVILRLIHDGNAEVARIPTDRGLVYGRSTVAGRVQSAVRTFSAKAEYAYDYGMPKWLARVNGWFEPLRLERLFLGRHKFYHFRTWYRHALAGYVKDMLLNPRALERSYFRAGVLKKLVEAHTSGRGNHTLEIHLALTFELIHQELLQARA